MLLAGAGSQVAARVHCVGEGDFVVETASLIGYKRQVYGLARIVVRGARHGCPGHSAVDCRKGTARLCGATRDRKRFTRR